MKQLSRLTEDQLTDLVAQRLDGKTYQECAEYLKSEYTIEYSRQAISTYMQSTEGIDKLSSVQEYFKAQWLDQVIAERSSRVNVLVFEAKRCRDKLRSMTPGAQDYLELSKELRAYLKQIHDEMEPQKLEVTTTGVSPFELYLDKLEPKKLEVLNTTVPLSGYDSII